MRLSPLFVLRRLNQLWITVTTVGADAPLRAQRQSGGFVETLTTVFV